MDRTLAGVGHHQPLRLGRHELYILELELQKGGSERCRREGVSEFHTLELETRLGNGVSPSPLWC